MVTKKEIRRQIRKLRSQNSINNFIAGSNVICGKVIRTEAFRVCGCVYCYIDCQEEVSTRRIVEEAFRLGKRVAAPKIVQDEMIFYYIHGYEDLEYGYFGVMEPITGELAQEEEALMIVPGVAFDRYRHRVGYGKGFYDRYLSAHKKHGTIAVGFDFQVLEEVEYDGKDQLPQVLMTEMRTYGMLK